MDTIAEQKYSIAEAAKRIGVAEITARRLVNRGLLGCYRVGNRRILVAEHHIEAFLAASEKPTIAQANRADAIFASIEKLTKEAADLAAQGETASSNMHQALDSLERLLSSPSTAVPSGPESSPDS